MARPKGLPRTGGRAKGTLNKVTADVKALAQQYGEVAMVELARLATKAESEAARVSAIKEIFDRAYGKASQLIGNDPDNPFPSSLIVELVKTNAANDTDS